MPSLTQRDRRALLILAAAVAVALLSQLDIFPRAGTGAVSSVAVDTAEKRLRRLQQVARQKPRSAAEAGAALRALAEAEKGLLKGATPALASADMQQIMKDLLQTQGINLQASEFGAVKPAGDDYAQVPLTVAFSCGIEQWINLMAAIRNAPQVLSTQEVRIVPGDAKNKLVQVRMIVAGYVPAALLPQGRAAGSF